MRKQTTLFIGGEERKLVFGLAGFYDHMEDACGGDAFAFMRKFIPEEGKEAANVSLSDSAVIFHAAINSGCDEDGKPNIEFAKVKQWVRAVEADKIAGVINDVFKLLEEEGQGEAKSQPEKGSD